VGIGAELGDQAEAGTSGDSEPLAQRFRGDRVLVVLPVQHVLGAGPVKQVLPARFACGLA
jgi:hypothetical protein